ncbi:hypothetical protein BJV82DRAFT_585240 [Fennellomyces sp. T-0311]|nr:hypothetical protein BJV82DRAFT_585240 [Fennellomyces sp. T-0311]
MHVLDTQYKLLSPYTIIVHRHTRTILLATEEACQILGYGSPHHLIGRTTDELEQHDILFNIYHDDPYDYWVINCTNQAKILRLSAYGTIQQTFPSDPSTTNHPIMRWIHPDDVQAFCRGLNQAYKQQHLSHTISMRYCGPDGDKYRPVLFTVLAGTIVEEDGSIGILRPHDYYGKTIFLYVMAYLMHLLFHLLFFLCGKQESQERYIKVNNEIVHYKKHDEIVLRDYFLTAVTDLRAYTESSSVVQRGLEWLEGTGVIKNKHGLVNSAQMTMEKLLDRILPEQ